MRRYISLSSNPHSQIRTPQSQIHNRIGLWSGRCLLRAARWAMFRREPSRLYTLPACCFASLSSALPAVLTVKVSPTLTPFTPAFPSGVLNYLSPLRLPIPPPRHHVGEKITCSRHKRPSPSQKALGWCKILKLLCCDAASTKLCVR